MSRLDIEPTGSNDFGPCPCCGNNSRRVCGFVDARKGVVAAYFVHWTLTRVRDHGANFDLIIGRWGEGSSARDRVLVSLAYRVDETGPSFMVIDAADRPAAGETDLVGRALARSEVIGQAIAQQAFDIVDAILEQDARVAELLPTPGI
ncbi:MAG: hypothetical protein J2P46_22375 [Zavarzinella sp.]|nr:hypothetical protein [Zavarzinella sp.]